MILLRSILGYVMRIMTNMLRRREKYLGGQKALTCYLRCGACGSRFESGTVRLEKKYVIAAVCNPCTAKGCEPLVSYGTNIRSLFSEAHQRTPKAKRVPAASSWRA
jgi:hypothetical protein